MGLLHKYPIEGGAGAHCLSRFLNIWMVVTANFYGTALGCLKFIQDSGFLLTQLLGKLRKPGLEFYTFVLLDQGLCPIQG